MAPEAHPQFAEREARAAQADAAVSRQERGEQLRRARAAARLLRTAFPEVEELRIELSFEDPSSISPAAQAYLLYPPAPAFFTYRCPHSDCDGEFDLEGAVRKALRTSTHAAEGSLLCAGARTAQRGAKRSCELRLAYAVTARYHGRT